jgi:hypothetical protein
VKISYCQSEPIDLATDTPLDGNVTREPGIVAGLIERNEDRVRCSPR